MASPQLGNGYTTIANEILEVLMGIKINATQYKIMICLIRNTYGWNKKSGPLSVSYIAKATNLNDRQVRRELTALIDTKMVKVTKKQTATKPRELGINKNYEEWKDYKPRVGQGTKKTEGTTETPGPHGQERTTRTPQEKPKKEQVNYKEVYDYYKTLDLKNHRNYTDAMAKAIKKAMKENSLTIEECKKLLKRHEIKVKQSKSDKYPVKLRSITEFFGQKIDNNGGSPLICAQYMDGEKYGDIDPEAKSSHKAKKWGPKQEREIESYKSMIENSDFTEEEKQAYIDQKKKEIKEREKITD